MKSFLSFRNIISLIARIVPWRFVYAFIEKEECSKEEKAFGQSWEITRIFIFCVHAGLCCSSAVPLTRLTYAEMEK
jgi:hypothetical protein